MALPGQGSAFRGAKGNRAFSGCQVSLNYNVIMSIPFPDIAFGLLILRRIAPPRRSCPVA